MLKNRRNGRSNRGTSLIEVLTGAMFLIPIGLVAVDLVSLSMVEQVNEHIARDAARAAANQLDANSAKQAAQKAVTMYQKNALITNVQVSVLSYSDDAVQLQTTIDARVPAPIFGFGGKKLIAQSFQPVVAKPAEL